MKIKSITIVFDSVEEFNVFNYKFMENLQYAQAKGGEIIATYKNVDLHISEVKE